MADCIDITEYVSVKEIPVLGSGVHQWHLEDQFGVEVVPEPNVKGSPSKHYALFHCKRCGVKVKRRWMKTVLPEKGCR